MNLITLLNYKLRGDDGEWPSPIDLRATEEDVKLILDLHNDLRQRVASGKEIRGSPGPQPAAGFIPNLVHIAIKRY